MSKHINRNVATGEGTERRVSQPEGFFGMEIRFVSFHVTTTLITLL